LNLELEDAQNEILFTLGDIVEKRSKETGNHVRRVGEYCKMIALLLGFREDQSETLKVASAMHDIGKLGIPDEILLKPGTLSEDELGIIKTHSAIGNEMLHYSHREIIVIAALIALQHHEHYDGTGYPRRLKGEDINIFARITAVADVFDALSNKRIYKDAWTVEKIIEYFISEKGEKFDPNIVDIFVKNIDQALIIKKKYELPDY
jgi:response regulator RpfG family c-di-GMP phosphodiesterase